MLRLLLDAHVSGRVMATALAKRGHDVRALTDEPALEGLDDEDVLRLAVEQDRILVTYDVKVSRPCCAPGQRPGGDMRDASSSTAWTTGSSGGSFVAWTASSPPDPRKRSGAISPSFSRAPELGDLPAVHCPCQRFAAH